MAHNTHGARPRQKAAMIRGEQRHAFKGDRQRLARTGALALSLCFSQPGCPRHPLLRVPQFAAEFQCCVDIATCPKPYIALMQGVTMGFGLGLAAHGRYRVVARLTSLVFPPPGCVEHGKVRRHGTDRRAVGCVTGTVHCGCSVGGSDGATDGQGVCASTAVAAG